MTAVDLNEIDFHYNTMSVLAPVAAEWSVAVQDLIGTEDVEFKFKDEKKGIVFARIWSTDKDALDRVLTLAAEAGE